MECALHECRPATLGVLPVDFRPPLDQDLNYVPPAQHGGYHEGGGTIQGGAVALHGVVIQDPLYQFDVTCLLLIFQ